MGKGRAVRGRLVIVVVGLAAVARPVASEELSVGSSARYEMAPNASGFFIDMDGTVLTARHAVEGCQTLYTLKDGRVTRAELVAVSKDADLAVVRSPLKPYLAASFAADTDVRNSQPVFAAGYEELRHMKDRNRLMYNGFALDRPTRPEERRFMLFSDAVHGASGSPVLNADGLVIGVVVRRDATGSPSGQSVVIAVAEDAVEAFLRDAGIAFRQGNQAEIGPLQARAPRAATLTVGIICG